MVCFVGSLVSGEDRWVMLSSHITGGSKDVLIRLIGDPNVFLRGAVEDIPRDVVAQHDTIEFNALAVHYG